MTVERSDKLERAIGYYPHVALVLSVLMFCLFAVLVWFQVSTPRANSRQLWQIQKELRETRQELQEMRREMKQRKE